MSDALIGKVVDGRHRVDGVLGKGGFATVYRGVDTQSGRLVAIKVLDEELRDSNRSRSRFERETEAVSKLSNAHTVSLISHGECDGAPFIIFEFVDGKDLAEILAEQERLDGDVVLHVLRQVLESLHEAHAAGIIHRDLKPENIRVFQHVDDPWFVKVLDFGVARMAAPAGGNLTLNGEIIGTPRYMSPEQLLGETPGPSSDIYSLGLVAIELLLGRESLQGNRWSDQFSRLESGHFFAPAGIANAQLVAVLQRMTARAQQDRYQSALEVLAPLETLAASRTIERTVEDANNTTLRGDAPVPKRKNATTPPTTDVTSQRVQEQSRPPAPASRSPRPPVVARGVTEARGQTELPSWLRSVVFFALGGVVVGSILHFGGPSVEERPTPRIRPNPAPTILKTTPAPSPAAGAAKKVESAPAPDMNADVGTHPCERLTERSGEVMLAGMPTAVMYFPSEGYDPRQQHSLVILLSDPLEPPADALKASRITSLADKHDFLVLATKARRVGAKPDPARVATLLQKAVTTACVDLARVFVVGQGEAAGREAHEFACTANVAGIATHGYVPRDGYWPCRADPVVPTMMFFGEDDKFAPTSGRRSCTDSYYYSRRQIEFEFGHRHGCGGNANFRLKRKRAVCERYDCSTPLFLCAVGGNGRWPGSTRSFELPGCSSSNPDYPVMTRIWKFFSERPSVNIPRP